MHPLMHAWRFAGLLVVFTVSSSAHAFTLSSLVSTGCHEEITETALRSVRATLTTANTITPTEDERALIADLPFTLDADMQDLASASLLVGVRDNDLKGRSPAALDQLAAVHGNPNAQEEHCLRAPEDDEPGGSAAAIARCSSFIHDRAMSALDGLDGSGVPDPNIRDDIAVSLSLRGGVTAPLPAFWVRIGQAMHTLEDAFAHTYRTPDGMAITVVLNWVDLVDKQLDETRDGPSHKVDLDKCNAGDTVRSRNKALAIEASTSLLETTLDPTLTRAQKSDAVNVLLAKYLAYFPGCTSDNAWCSAAENTYTATGGCGCNLAGIHGSSLATLAFGAFVVIAIARKRRRNAAAGALFLVLVASPARADEQVEAKKEAVHQDHPFAIAATFDGSIIDPAAAASLGVRFRVNDRIVLGLDAELNAWYGVNNGRFELGAASLYATGIYRFPMRFERVNLRTTINIGASYELLSLYGVPSGSVGFFVGAYPLGIEWRLSGRVFIIFNPLGVGIPIPHLTGVPFAYPQFRTQLGVEIAF